MCYFLLNIGLDKSQFTMITFTFVNYVYKYIITNVSMIFFILIMHIIGIKYDIFYIICVYNQCKKVTHIGSNI